MVAVEVKRLHIVNSRGKTYVYAWRGGPRVHGTPGTPEFFAAYQEVVATHRIPDRKRFRSVIQRYRASPYYAQLAATTRKNWSGWLDKIDDRFGDLSTKQFDRADKIKPMIRKWRGEFAETPRTADYAMQVLSRVLSYAVDPLGELATNPCEGIKHLYANDRSAIIWTEEDIGLILPHCSAEVALAIELAAHTGLRSSDLVRLSWSHVGEDAIIIRTGKSRVMRNGKEAFQREAVIPLYDELRDLLKRIPRRSTAVLTNSLKKPWTKDGLGSRFAEAKKKAWPDDTELNFHDLRGTAATKFYLAGFPEREIAEMMGWEEEAVSRIIRRYVTRSAAIRERIRRLREARGG